MASESPSIRIHTDELRTVREAMRDLGSLLAELDAGQVRKLVLTQRNRIRAVVITVERWSELERLLAAAGETLTELTAPDVGSRSAPGGADAAHEPS